MSGVTIDRLKSQISAAFAEVEYPGDGHLRNSDEGVEPFLLEEDFKGEDDWTKLSPAFLDLAPDGYATALSFFSAEAFRFYIPAYLLADLAGRLQSTDVIFYLTHGLTDATREVRVNPRRYGDLTWFDYVSDRFSGFSHDQARAIAAYLRFKRGADLTEPERRAIDQAVDSFWGPLARGR